MSVNRLLSRGRVKLGHPTSRVSPAIFMMPHFAFIPTLFMPSFDGTLRIPACLLALGFGRQHSELNLQLLRRLRTGSVCQHARLLKAKWRAQKLLDREMGKLHDVSVRPQIMLFSYFSVKEILDSSHLVPPSRFLSDYHIHSDALCYAYLCVLIDQDSYNVLRPYMILTNGRCVQFRSCHAKKV